MSHWQSVLDIQYRRNRGADGRMKLTHAEMLAMAEELDAMRQSVNLHNSGAMAGTIYHHIEQAEIGILAHLFGKDRADAIMSDAIECGSTIPDIIRNSRRSDEIEADHKNYMLRTYPEGCQLCRKIGHPFSENCLD